MKLELSSTSNILLQLDFYNILHRLAKLEEMKNRQMEIENAIKKMKEFDPEFETDDML